MWTWLWHIRVACVTERANAKTLRFIGAGKCKMRGKLAFDFTVGHQLCSSLPGSSFSSFSGKNTVSWREFIKQHAIALSGCGCVTTLDLVWIEPDIFGLDSVMACLSENEMYQHIEESMRVACKKTETWQRPRGDEEVSAAGSNHPHENDKGVMLVSGEARRCWRCGYYDICCECSKRSPRSSPETHFEIDLKVDLTRISSMRLSCSR